MTLTALFLKDLRGGSDRISATAALEEALTAIRDAGRAAWPDIGLPDETFIRHLAGRLPEKGDVLQILGKIQGTDLYLACGCAHGSPKALAAFQQHFMVPLSHYLGRHDSAAGYAEDLKQAVSERILVGDGGVLPRIGTYTGSGPLAAWLRIVAVRLAVNLRRMLAGDGEGALEVGDLPVVAPDPEIHHLKARYGSEFRAAFAKTLVRLSPRSASVLRLYFLQGLTAAAIGAIYHVSERTVHRWLTITRQKILDETHMRLRKKLEISTSQLDSLIAVFYTELRVEIEKFSDKQIRAKPPEPG